MFWEMGNFNPKGKKLCEVLGVSLESTPTSAGGAHERGG